MEQLLGKQVNIYYAMKANPFLTAAAARAAGGLEVCSPGEYDICRRARVPAQKIVLSGVNKEDPTSARSWQSREPEPTQLNP